MIPVGNMLAIAKQPPCQEAQTTRSSLAIIPPMQVAQTFVAIAFCAWTCVPARAAAPARAADIQATPLPPAADIADPAIPLRIPGYELRVLDRRKPVRFHVAGVWAESTLPIFVYVPTGDPGHAAGFLRHAYDALLKLALKPEWTAAELQAVLTDLDSALRAFEEDNPETAARAGSRPAAR
jgi:hypothetical protein